MSSSAPYFWDENTGTWTKIQGRRGPIGPIGPDGPAGTVGPGMPAGAVVPFAGPAANIPSGWLLCNGAVVNRTTFAALFAAIGTTYGVGDGSTTFNVPNMMVGRTVIGADATSPHGSAGGARTHTLTLAEMPAHSHGLSHAATWRFPNGTGSLAAGNEFRSYGTGVPTTEAAGGGGAHNNMPPFIAMQWIIRT